MTAIELIEKLQKIVDEKGDATIYIHGEDLRTVDFVLDDDYKNEPWILLDS